MVFTWGNNGCNHYFPSFLAKSYQIRALKENFHKKFKDFLKMLLAKAHGQYHMVKPRKILYDAFHVILHIQ